MPRQQGLLRLLAGNGHRQRGGGLVLVVRGRHLDGEALFYAKVGRRERSMTGNKVWTCSDESCFD